MKYFEVGEGTILSLLNVAIIGMCVIYILYYCFIFITRPLSPLLSLLGQHPVATWDLKTTLEKNYCKFVRKEKETSKVSDSYCVLVM